MLSGKALRLRTIALYYGVHERAVLVLLEKHEAPEFRTSFHHSPYVDEGQAAQELSCKLTIQGRALGQLK